MDVLVRYFDDCPSWRDTLDRLSAALAATGHPEVQVRLERVQTQERAEEVGFPGSPTVLIDGRDPFDNGGRAVGLACRLYLTPEGLRGSPTQAQLEDVLRGRQPRP